MGYSFHCSQSTKTGSPITASFFVFLSVSTACAYLFRQPQLSYLNDGVDYKFKAVALALDQGQEQGERGGFYCGDSNVHRDRVGASIAIRDLNNKAIRANVVRGGGGVGDDHGCSRAAR